MFKTVKRFASGALAAAGIAACALVSAPLRATPVGPAGVTFYDQTCSSMCSTDGTDGNKRTFTFFDAQGLASRVEVTAWSATQATTGSTAGQLSNYQTAFLGQYDGAGLGVTNRSEDGSTNNAHTADNYQGIDLIVFHFDGDVRVTLAGLIAYAMTATGFSGSGTDSDASFYIGSTTVPFGTAIDLTNAAQRLSILNHYTDTLGDGTDNTAYRYFNNGSTYFTGNTLVIAPSLADYSRGSANGNRPDAFKVAGLQVEYLAAQTPEPAALGLFGLGVAGLAIRRRRKR